MPEYLSELEVWNIETSMLRLHTLFIFFETHGEKTETVTENEGFKP